MHSYTYIYFDKNNKRREGSGLFRDMDEVRSYCLKMMRDGKVCWLNKIKSSKVTSQARGRYYVSYPAGEMMVTIRKDTLARIGGHLFYNSLTGKAHWMMDNGKSREVSDNGKLKK